MLFDEHENSDAAAKLVLTEGCAAALKDDGACRDEWVRPVRGSRPWPSKRSGCGHSPVAGSSRSGVVPVGTGLTVWIRTGLTEGRSEGEPL